MEAEIIVYGWVIQTLFSEIFGKAIYQWQRLRLSQLILKDSRWPIQREGPRGIERPAYSHHFPNIADASQITGRQTF
jgi:hypothetical protein